MRQWNDNMKRILNIVLMLTLCAVSYAQITRSVYGISLGDTETTVLQIMSSKNLTIEPQTSQHGKILGGTGDVIFAGESWDAVSVTLRNGKVYGIMFIKEKEREEGRQLLYTFSAVCKALIDKYSSYALTPISKEYSYGADMSFVFSDKKTSVACNLQIRPETKTIMTLGYVDNPELDTQSSDNANEL